MQLTGIWLKIQTSAHRTFQFPSSGLHNFQCMGTETGLNSNAILKRKDMMNVLADS